MLQGLNTVNNNIYLQKLNDNYVLAGLVPQNSEYGNTANLIKQAGCK